jgi:AcrR family transcriptional regulator
MKNNLRTQQAEERRHQILNAALEIFSHKGYEGTSIKDIARAANISLGLIYHYFPGKEALLEDCVKYHGFIQQMHTILANTSGRTVFEVFYELSCGFLDLLDRKSDLVSLFLHEVDTNPVVKKAWSNLVLEGVSLLQKYFETQVAAGSIKITHTESAARNLLGTIFMFHLTREVFKSSSISREIYIKDAINIMLDGIGIK